MAHLDHSNNHFVADVLTFDRHKRFLIRVLFTTCLSPWWWIIKWFFHGMLKDGEKKKIGQAMDIGYSSPLHHHFGDDHPFRGTNGHQMIRLLVNITFPLLLIDILISWPTFCSCPKSFSVYALKFWCVSEKESELNRPFKCCPDISSIPQIFSVSQRNRKTFFSYPFIN